MSFNIMINNVDDHLRNHGFLRGKRGWVLSPAYDVNPISKTEKAPRLVTAIVDDDFNADLQTAIDAAEFFGLTKADAQEICDQVHVAVSKWRQTAEATGASHTSGWQYHNRTGVVLSAARGRASAHSSRSRT